MAVQAARRVHACEQGVLINSELSSNEEEARLVIDCRCDGKHVGLRLTQPAAVGRSQHMIQVLLVTATDWASING